MISLQNSESYKDDIYDKRTGNKNGTKYSYYSNQNNNQYGQQMNANEQLKNTVNEIESQSNNQ